MDELARHALVTAQTHFVAAERARDEAVLLVRNMGWSWAQIAEVVGMSKQGAASRWKKVGEPDPVKVEGTARLEAVALGEADPNHAQ